jgi:hypothetical protein
MKVDAVTDANGYWKNDTVTVLIVGILLGAGYVLHDKPCLGM